MSVSGDGCFSKLFFLEDIKNHIGPINSFNSNDTPLQCNKNC